MVAEREYEQTAGGGSPDQVLVRVREDNDGELIATVSWGNWMNDGVAIKGETSEPMPVGRALIRADEIASLYGFSQVVVSLPGADVWNPNWGTLRRSATDLDSVEDEDLENIGREADDGDEGGSPLIEWPEDNDDSEPSR